MMKICSYCIHPYIINNIPNTTDTIINDIRETNICYECFNIIDEEVSEYGCRFCKLLFGEKNLLQIHIKQMHPVNSIKLKITPNNTLKESRKSIPAQTKNLHNMLILHLTSPREQVRHETKKQILETVHSHKPTYKISEKILGLQKKLIETSTSKVRSKSTPKYH